MSTQSILIQNLSSLQEKFDNKLLEMGHNYSLNRRFMIGEEVNPDEIMFVKSFHKLLCTDNCELIDYIDKKIKGKLAECGVKVKKKPTISDLFKLYQQQVEACSITEACGVCDWEKTEW